MQNLDILISGVTNLLENRGEKGEELVGYTIDEFSHQLHTVTNKNMIHSFNYNQHFPTDSIKDITSTPVFGEGKLVNVTSIAEQNYVCLVYESGQIFLYKNEEIEEAGNLPEGIIGASWSPN